MPKTLAKTKVWIKDHKEQIYTTTFVAGVVTVYAGLIVASIKASDAYNRQQEQIQANIAEAVSRGAQVLPGPNDTYWIIEPKS